MTDHTFSRCTALRVIMKAGGSGALARNSAIGQFTGANNLVCRQISYNRSKVTGLNELVKLLII